MNSAADQIYPAKVGSAEGMGTFYYCWHIPFASASCAASSIPEAREGR